MSVFARDGAVINGVLGKMATWIVFGSRMGRDQGNILAT